MKFNRNYKLTIETTSGATINIEPPFTLEFEISRNSFSSANAASFRILNLSGARRTQIRKDTQDTGEIRKIYFAAGYGDKLSLGFEGNIASAFSIREGPNFVTQIESYDGGFAYVNAVVNLPFQSGTSQKTIIQAIIKQLPGIQPGAIGDFESTLSRGNSYSGSAIDALASISGDKAFIDGGRLHCLNDDECIEGPTLLINAKSGLLNTPLRENTFVNIETIFEPSIQVGRLITLESTTADHFTGEYRVLSVRHRGVISDVASGTCTSSIGLLPGEFAPIRIGT